MERRRSAFSGSWYPGTAHECRAEIETFLVEKAGPAKGRFVGGIVPHAGWYFSGSIACRTIASLTPAEVVAVFGMHMPATGKPVTLGAGSWQTPFGDIPIHAELAALAADRAGIRVQGSSGFPEENTIELQLPFVRYFFPSASLVAVGVPASLQTAVEVGEAVVEAAAGLGVSLVVIGSSDMTHYGANYGFFPVGSGRKAYDWVRKTNDRSALDAMLAMDEATVIDQAGTRHNLCCAGAVAAATAAAKKLGAERGVELDYATSYEKHPGESFVGYSGVLFEKRA